MTALQSYSGAARGPLLLSLPFEIRRCIFQQVLDVCQYVCVFRDPGGRVESFSPGKPKGWLSLLYVNRQVSVEARVVLYGNNDFLMASCGQEQVAESFFKLIGMENASLIRSACIHFAEVDTIIRQLDILTEYCVGLTTLEALQYGSWLSSSSRVAETVERGEAAGAVQLVDDMDCRMRNIGKVNKVIVRVYGSSSSGAVLQHMRQRGWTIVCGGA